jgi:hypothetical protein
MNTDLILKNIGRHIKLEGPESEQVCSLLMAKKRKGFL